MPVIELLGRKNPICLNPYLYRARISAYRDPIPHQSAFGGVLMSRRDSCATGRVTAVSRID
jgi:hypothetical protein